MDKMIVKNGQSKAADFSGYRFWKEGDDLPDFPVPLAKRPDHWLEDKGRKKEESHFSSSLRSGVTKLDEKPSDVTEKKEHTLHVVKNSEPVASEKVEKQDNSETIKASSSKDIVFHEEENQNVNGAPIDDVAQAFENAQKEQKESGVEDVWLATQPALRVYHVSDANEDENTDTTLTGKEFYAVAMAHVTGPLTEMVNQTAVRYGEDLGGQEEQQVIDTLVKQVMVLAECVENHITLEGEWAQSVSWRFVRAARHVVQNGYHLRYTPMDEAFFGRVCERVSDLSGHVLCLAPDHLDEQEFSLHDRIDLFEALSPLIVPVEWYAFGHNSFDLIKKNSRELLARTKDFCQEMHAKGSVCHKLEILKRFSVLYGECHLMEMNRLGRMTPEEQASYGQSYGNTLPLTPVWSALANKVDLLARQSLKLAEHAGKRLKGLRSGE